jgi:geranylgeranyl reductase
MEKYETVIVGAGPAGLKCAETLAKEGREVLVLEKDNVFGDKVCAGGLTLKDLELGIPEDIIERKFKKVIIHTPFQKTEVKEKDFFVATVDRKTLGKSMAKQAEKEGAEIRKKSKVEKILKNHVVLAGGKKIGFKYLVGADGANSIVRKSVGLKDKDVLMAIQYKTRKKFRNMEFFLDYSKLGPFYVWIFPHKDYAVVGVDGNLNTAKTESLKNNLNKLCKGKFDIKKAKLQAHTIRWGYRGYKFGNKFLIGDAGGFSSELTGEGICFAMLSGIDAARKIINPRYKCKNIEHILKVKSVEDGIIKHMEKHKTLAKIEIETLALLAKSKFVDREIIAHID